MGTIGGNTIRCSAQRKTRRLESTWQRVRERMSKEGRKEVVAEGDILSEVWGRVQSLRRCRQSINGSIFNTERSVESMTTRS